MNVLCCYTTKPSWAYGGQHTGLCEETKAVMEQVGAKMVDVTGNDFGYWQSCVDMWNKHEGFIVVEHDIVPTVEQLQDLWDCPHPWCLYQYTILGNPRQSGFGCNKHSAALTRSFPGAMQNCGNSWHALDLQLAAQLTKAGLTAHIHQGSVRHLNPHHIGDNVRWL